MKVLEFADPTEFRSFVDPFLLENEAQNNLFLGVTGTLIDRPTVYDQYHLWAVSRQGKPLAAAAMTPPNNLLLADGASMSSLTTLAEFLHESDVSLPGAQGTLPGVEHFCRAWATTADVAPQLEVQMGIHALERVRVPTPPAGDSRVAVPDDFELMVAWMTAFLDEADPLSPRSHLERAVRGRLGLDPELGGTWIWEVENEPVAMSGYSGRTPNGMRIGPVYTPPHARRQGYATALVARLSAWLLEQGRRFCFLYTNMANPTANSIYRKVGYQMVGEAARYRFNPPSPKTG